MFYKMHIQRAVLFETSENPKLQHEALYGAEPQFLEVEATDIQVKNGHYQEK